MNAFLSTEEEESRFPKLQRLKAAITRTKSRTDLQAAVASGAAELPVMDWDKEKDGGEIVRQITEKRPQLRRGPWKRVRKVGKGPEVEADW